MTEIGNIILIVKKCSGRWRDLEGVRKWNRHSNFVVNNGAKEALSFGESFANRLACMFLKSGKINVMVILSVQTFPENWKAFESA